MIWSEVPGSASSYAIARHVENTAALILTSREYEAELLAREICFFAPSLTERIVFIPDSEILPFDLEQPSIATLSKRAMGFSRLFSGTIAKPVVICCIQNAMRRLAGSSFWKEHIDLKVGEPVPTEFGNKLSEWGYHPSFRVKASGQYSQRGRVMDLHANGGFVNGAELQHSAVRITIDGSVITSLKKLDTLTQVSSARFDHFRLYPMRDYRMDKQLIEGFRKGAFGAHPDPRSTAVYKGVSNAEDHPELRWWMSRSSDGMTSIFQAMENPHVILFEKTRQAMLDFDDLIRSRHGEVKRDPSRIIPDVEDGFCMRDDVDAWLKQRDQVIELSSTIPANAIQHGFAPSGMLRMASLNESLEKLRGLVVNDGDTLFVIKSDVRIKHIEVMVRMMGLKPVIIKSFAEFLAAQAQAGKQQARVFIARGSLENGHANLKKRYRLITEMEIFGAAIDTRLDDEVSEHHRRIILQGLHEIELGEPLVHAIHGVGRFAGFEKINMSMKQGAEEDVLKIAYADNAMAFVRIQDLDLISRYSGGNPAKAPLSRLGDPSWLENIKKAQTSALSVADELIKIRAVREMSVGITLTPADSRYDRFCDVFVYQETLDQIQAVNDIISDLTSGKPMDRLVCGDVGFGKTEVAMRAAFLVASQGYQVVVLAPTTILAEQHFQSFISRFEETNISIKLANRNTLTKADLNEIRTGQVSIIIGTHRLLQNDLKFKELGLIIVDEEHRFGVQQKEALRAMRGNKHMLALTATPIPRTLGMAISGIRDLSILATPPASRQSIRTIVSKFSDATLVTGITRELARNGQVFFLHNLIETMDERVAHLQRLFPTARIRKLHGKMGEMDMARTMMAFRKHEFDILVSTTVIEIGIDVPNANTLIIEGAENLGLAQLHQLRGRVGRSSRQAYAYLLHQKAGHVGLKRLEAMVKASNLGEGIMIARHDMEIRGIGEILGDEQSGHVYEIGFTLYMKLLEQAIRSIERSGSNMGLMLSNVEMPITGSIPPELIEQAGERLAWYQRLISSENLQDLDTNLAELEDLYGYIPREVQRLNDSIRTHIALRAWGVKKVTQDGADVTVILHEDSPPDVHVLVRGLFDAIRLGNRRNQLVIENMSAAAVIAVLLKNQQ